VLTLSIIATFSTIIGGILSDIYPAEHRNIPMACFSGSVFFATGLGPLIPSFIVTRTSWRWVHYSLGIVSGTFVLLLFLFLSETRGSVLLSCKAKALNRYYDELETSGYGLVVGQEGTTGTEIRRVRWKVAGDEERESVWKMIRISSSRPFRKLFAPAAE
jgi:MFS family permease